MTTMTPAEFLAFMLLAMECKGHKRVAWVDTSDARGRRIRSGIENCEHVLGHTGSIGLMVMLCQHVHEVSDDVDMAHAMKLAMVHDVLCEWEHGDSNGPHVEKDRAQKRILEVEKLAIERASVQKILATLPMEVAVEMERYWEEYVADVTPEAKLVKQLDKLEFLLQAFFYTQKGETVPFYAFLRGVMEKVTHTWLRSVICEMRTMLEQKELTEMEGLQ